MASCWDLLSCFPGIYPDISSYTNTDISVYEGQYVYINGDNTQIYQVVPLTESECISTENNDITLITIVPNCNESCGCPEGFIYNSILNICIGQSTIQATINGDNYTVELAQDVISYGNAGGAFYPLLDGLSLPIKRFGTVAALFQNNSIPYNLDPAVSPNPSFPIWKDRLNIAGVWNSSVPFDEWVGFTECINVDQTTIYTIGIASDNRCRFKINGQLIFTTEDTNLNSWNFRYWHLLPITLNAGQNIIEVESFNENSQAAFAAEIYKVNTQVLSLVTTIEELAQITIFSTINKVGDLFDLGETIGYSCPAGYSLSTCDGSYICKAILEAPYFQCCVQLQDCSGVLEDILVKENFEAIINTVVKLHEYPETCWLVVDRKLQCTEESILINVVESFNTCTSCSQSFFNIEPCEIVPEIVDPNFSTKFCDEEQTIERYCNFADNIYIIYKTLKYGITSCCDIDYDKAFIKFEIIRLQELYDPSLCIDIVPIIPNPCEPQPEPIICPIDTSELCTPPTGVTASISYLT